MKAVADVASSAHQNSRGANLKWQDLYYMTKPGVALLVVVTAVPTMLMATGQLPEPLVALGTLVGTALAAASAAVFNQMIDSGIDARMSRTAARPLAAEKLSLFGAACYGTLLAVIGLGMICWLATPLASLIAFLGNVFYVVIYSIILKKRTPQNIVIGGAAGAIGPLIGWAAVTGEIGLAAWLLFLLIFLWTPPHFWALAIKYKDDYAKANIPMFPVVYGEEKTRKYIFLYSLTLLIPVVGLYWLDTVGHVFFVVSLILTLMFIGKALRLYKSHESRLTMNVFHFSCLYLFLIFVGLSVEQMIAVLT